MEVLLYNIKFYQNEIRTNWDWYYSYDEVQLSITPSSVYYACFVYMTKCKAKLHILKNMHEFEL